jgi:peptidoglycan-N-acetylglucosamine deacetylase
MSGPMRAAPSPPGPGAAVGTAGSHGTGLILRAAPLALALVLALGIAVEGSSTVITRGSDQRAMVALTFDDGWSLPNCERIAEVLRQTRTPATFFINGSNIARDPARWRALLEGFEVANHTRSHPFLPRIPDASIRREVAGDERLIESILGREMLRMVRPPYGAYDQRVLRVLGEIGYDRTVLWDRSSGDTSSGATATRVFRAATRGRGGSIVLMHCGPSATPAALPAIIKSYRARGYRLVGLTDLLGARGAGDPRAP